MGKVRTVALWSGSIVGSIVLFIVIGLSLLGTGENRPSRTGATDSRQAISTATPSNLSSSGRVADAFTLFTDMTRLQVDQLEKEVRGTVVQWYGPVHEVDDTDSGLVVYIDETPTSVAFECWITSPTTEDQAYAAGLRRGQRVGCKGVIDRAATFGGLVISPSVFVP